MTPAKSPQPFGASFSLRGRAAEITALADELEDELTSKGWQVDERTNGKSPLRTRRLRRGPEWLVTAVAAPGPYKLSRPQEFEFIFSGSVLDRGRLHDQVAAVPFSQLELEALADEMPLTSSVRDRAPAWLPSVEVGARPLQGHGAIFTIHHQTDFVCLLEQAFALGVDPRLVTVIDKEYRYRFSARVDAHISRRLRVPVFKYAEIDAAIKDHIQRVAGSREQGSSTWTPTLVIDDGGYVLPRLLERFEPFLNLFKGVVEQTKSGIWKLRPYASDLPVPIFSVAESELKATVEAQGVAQAALNSLRTLLPQEKLDGRRAVVVGFGVIGQAVAESLRRNNVDVHIADTSASMLVTARERGFPGDASLPTLLDRVQPRYIFACAEPGAVGRESLEKIRTNCTLVSLTSRDVAFDKQALEAIAPSRPFGTVGRIHSRVDQACDMLLLADGFPVNFHFAESMPNQQSDLVMASLLVGAIALAASMPEWPAGNDAPRADAVLNEGTLLQDFLSLDPPIVPSGQYS